MSSCRAALLAAILAVCGLHADPSPAFDKAYVMDLSSDWKLDGDLPTHALLISLQGVANLDQPRLYFRYPSDWDFEFSGPLLDYYIESRGMEFETLSSADEALRKLARHADGYVVWDTSVRTSLIVAFTAAGLSESIVVSEELVPLAEKHGLRMAADFRGRFVGMSDHDIYAWAHETYFDACNKDVLVYLGGPAGDTMKPGIADLGIRMKAFFTDASTDPADTLEYRFATRLFSEMNPLAIVFGWHSYAKDLEAQHVTLASRHALRVEGLHSLPNMSFNQQIPLTPGYEFRNNHRIDPDRTYRPEKKTYIACIQTDCLGLGAWNEPGRGEIPYAWEVVMNWSWLAPALMQFFYDTATPNDTFIGSLSGPGYMYPKAIPEVHLEATIAEANRLMEVLDLDLFEIMDHADYWQTHAVDDDLTEELVNAYYRGMPDAIGFANGYRPGHTFAVSDGVPFVSFDYYLSRDRDEDEAAADLQELAALNPDRPYFLLLHVRQYNDIRRVQRILARLGPDFEVVPLDVFMKLAGSDPTFETRFAD
jgi:hypothetical protein